MRWGYRRVRQTLVILRCSKAVVPHSRDNMYAVIPKICSEFCTGWEM